jgi:hypothetical protein
MAVKYLFRLEVAIESKNEQLSERKAERLLQRVRHFIQVFDTISQETQSEPFIGTRYRDGKFAGEYHVVIAKLRFDSPDLYQISLAMDMVYRFCDLYEFDIQDNRMIRVVDRKGFPA